MSTRQLLIDGEWREPILKNYIPIVNPATQDVIGDIPAATKEDVEAAVNAARRAFSRNIGKDWAKEPAALRAKYLRAIITKVTERKSHLATLESVDCGKPLDETVWDMEDVAGCLMLLDAKQKAPVSLPMESFKRITPLLMVPSLAAGCTAVLKPSELPSVKLQVTTYVPRDTVDQLTHSPFLL